MEIRKTVTFVVDCVFCGRLLREYSDLKFDNMTENYKKLNLV